MNPFSQKKLIAVWTAAVVAAAPAAFAADAVPGLSLDQVKAVIDTASGLRALNHIRRLCLHHRWFVSDGYDAAAEYVREQAAAAGLENIVLHRFPSDGRICYSTQISLPRWTVRSAELSLTAPVHKHLTSWAESPITLASNSRSADVTAELVDVGEGVHISDYEGKDVAGKLVLASAPQTGGRIDLVHRLAVLERGAAGVIAYRGYLLDDNPDLVTWDHINTLELDGRPSTFGFCLSKRTGWALKRLLAGGQTVRLHAAVDADLGPGHFGVVEGRIPGTDARAGEIWFIAHLDHCRPSANDNASGAAALLETARALNRLVESGRLPRPRRTLRFLWVPEIWGTFAYLSEKTDEAARAAAVINFDMVGEDQSACGSVFEVTKTPDAVPSFLNDLLDLNLDFLLARETDPNADLTDPLSLFSPEGSREAWFARTVPYSGGSDHYVFMGGYPNVPATMFGSWPDAFYHSSGDTPDKSDPTQLKRAVTLGLLVGAGLAAMDAGSCVELMEIMAARGRARLQEAGATALARLRAEAEPGKSGREALNLVRWTARREHLALLSAAALCPGESAPAERAAALAGDTDRLADSLAGEIRDNLRALRRKAGLGEGLPPLTEEQRAAAKLIPTRNPAFPGPIESDWLIGKASRAEVEPFFRMGGAALYAIGAFMDGTLSVLDIRDAVSAENGPVKLEDVLGYIRLLERTGLVSMTRQP